MPASDEDALNQVVRDMGTDPAEIREYLRSHPEALELLRRRADEVPFIVKLGRLLGGVALGLVPVGIILAVGFWYDADSDHFDHSWRPWVATGLVLGSFAVICRGRWQQQFGDKSVREVFRKPAVSDQDD